MPVSSCRQALCCATWQSQEPFLIDASWPVHTAWGGPVLLCGSCAFVARALATGFEHCSDSVTGRRMAWSAP